MPSIELWVFLSTQLSILPRQRYKQNSAFQFCPSWKEEFDECCFTEPSGECSRIWKCHRMVQKHLAVLNIYGAHDWFARDKVSILIYRIHTCP